MHRKCFLGQIFPPCIPQGLQSSETSEMVCLSDRGVYPKSVMVAPKIAKVGILNAEAMWMGEESLEITHFALEIM